MFFSLTCMAQGQERIYRIGMLESPPLTMRSEDGDIIGVLPALLDRISKDSGIKFKYFSSPLRRLMRDIDLKQFDFIIRGSAGADLKRDLILLNNISMVIVGRVGGGLKSIDELKGKPVALPSALANSSSLRGIENVTILPYDSILQAFDLLNKERADYILGYRDDIAYHAHKYNQKLGSTAHYERTYIDLMKVTDVPPEVIEKLSLAIKAITADGTLRDITIKSLSEYRGEPFVESLLPDQ